jgi:dipeptidyl aminopeptidase/acylaminoacyl peptidase
MHKILVLFFLSFTILHSQDSTKGPVTIEKNTFAFIERDSTLYMDFYSDTSDSKTRPCVIFVFGGGFARGARDREFYHPYFRTLVKNGYRVASIDYRLGLAGIYDEVNIFNTDPLKKAIDMAVEDLYLATAFLLSRAEELRIDPENFIVSGSSAGAITSLHADWYKRNAHVLSEILPSGFQYNGVVSFAGAIFSTRGKPTYKIPPAPTLFFHGSEDKTVPFNKKQLFNKGFFGSNYLAKLFSKKAYLYYLFKQVGAGHEVAVTPMTERLPEVLEFMETAVLQPSEFRREVTIAPVGSQ